MLYGLKRLWCGLTVSHYYAKSRRRAGYYHCRNCGHSLKVTEID